MTLGIFDFDTRVGVYGIATRPGAEGTEILLTLWNEPQVPQWTLPGGGVDYGEDFPDALHREFFEETGHTIGIGPLLRVDQDCYEAAQRLQPNGDRPLRAVRLFYDVTIIGGELGTTEVGGSTDEARWLPLAEAAAAPHTAPVDAALALLTGRA